jgi:hypothetical protein
VKPALAGPLELPRWAVRTLGALLALAIGYTLFRGLVVGLEYFDGYQFLVTAKRLAGDRSAGGFNLVRPPLLALLDMPALWLAQRGAPANALYTVGPHLTAAMLAALSALAVYYAFAASLEARLALLGVVFFVTGRLFVRYGSLTMADIISMAGGALALGLHRRSLERPTFARDALCGVAIGLAAAAKYPLLLMGAVVVLTEALVAVHRRRLPLRRVGGLAVTGAASATTFLALLALAYGLGAGWAQLGRFPRALLDTFKLATGMVAALPGESRWDNAWMLAATIAWPLLALAALGLGLLVKQRQERDYPFLAWLLGLGGILVATVGHNEVRYLLPVIPALLYFAVRGAEWLLRRAPTPTAAGAGLVALAITCSAGGLRQAWADADPVFRADTQRKAAAAVANLRRPGGHPRWIGPFSCIYPLRRVPLKYDEFFDSFNFFGPSMLYFLGEPATVIPSLAAAADGDAVVVAGPNCNGAALPSVPTQPWTVYGVTRRPLVSSGGGYATAAKDLAVTLAGEGAGWKVRVATGLPPRADSQRYLVVSDPAPRLLGPAPLGAGGALPYGGSDASRLKSIELLDLTVVQVPTR